MDPLRLFAEHEVPIPDDAAILVYTGVHLAGRLAAKNHAPIDFDDFVRSCQLGHAVSANHRRARPGPREPKIQQNA